MRAAVLTWGDMERSIMTMLTRAADGAMLADEQGQVVFWNKAAELLLGFRAEDVRGRPCQDVMRGETLSGHPFCSPSCAIGHQLGCGRAVRNFDIRTHTKAGTVMWLNVSSLPVPSRKRNRYRFVHLFRDISSQAKIQSLLDALRTVLTTPPQLDASRADNLTAPRSFPEIPSDLPLSARERDVLRYMGAGMKTRAIADGLCISPATVRNHVQHILDKLGAHSRLEALAVAFHRYAPCS